MRLARWVDFAAVVLSSLANKHSRQTRGAVAVRVLLLWDFDGNRFVRTYFSGGGGAAA